MKYLQVHHKPQELCDKKSNCTPSLLKVGQSNKRKKELLSIKEIVGEKQKLLGRFTKEIISCNISGQEKNN